MEEEEEGGSGRKRKAEEDGRVGRKGKAPAPLQSPPPPPPPVADAVADADAVVPSLVVIGTKDRPRGKNGRAVAAAPPRQRLSEPESAHLTAATANPTTTAQPAGAMTSPPSKKRRKVGHACVYCRRSHMTCDLSRPCERCRARGIGHICHDEPRDHPPSAGKQGSGSPVAARFSSPEVSTPAATTATTTTPTTTKATQGPGGDGMDQRRDISLVSPPPPPPPPPPPSRGLDATGGNLTESHTYPDLWLQAQGPSLPMHDRYHSAYLFPPEVEATHEFNFLHNFLYQAQLLNEGAPPVPPPSQPPSQPPPPPPNMVPPFEPPPPSPTAAASNRLPPLAPPPPLPPPHPHPHPHIFAATATASSSASSSSSSLSPSHQHQHQRQHQAQHQLQTQQQQRPLFHPPTAPPSIPPDKARENYYLQAADPSGNDTPERRMQSLLRAKYEAGLLRPFNYVGGYKRLADFLNRPGNVSAPSRARVLRALDRFRPKFREKAQALTDMELVYVEMWFEKQLMEYDRVFASMAVPACCWRRTGEICRANREMAELIDVPVDHLRDGKLSLHEILTEDSLVRYWEEFGTIAFDPQHDTLLTACELRLPTDPGKRTVKCSFSFMIRRDEHKIPNIVVGNFMSDNPAP